jgi:hypothetical protein
VCGEDVESPLFGPERGEVAAIVSAIELDLPAALLCPQP